MLASNKRFWLLDRMRARSRWDTTYLPEDPVYTGEAPQCDVCQRFVGMLAWLPPLRATLRLYGREFGDVAYGISLDLLVSEAFVAAWSRDRLLGISSFDPVEIVSVRGRARSRPRPTYFRASIVRAGPAVDEARSHIVRTGDIVCPACREADGVDAVFGFAIEDQTWSGEDLFIPRGLPGSAVASDRFAGFVERNELTNVALVPTERYKWDPLQLGPR